jgi:hypothetical protein
MVHRKIIDQAVQHKGLLIFAAGVATAVVGKKILESKAVKEATTNAVAGVMAVKQDAEDRLEEIKADAEAQIADDEDKVEIEVEAEEVEEEEEEEPKASKKSKK